MQVSGMSTNTVLRDLQPDTKYTVTLVPVYTEVEGKRLSADGKTSKGTDMCLEAHMQHLQQQSFGPEVLMVTFNP